MPVLTAYCRWTRVDETLDSLTQRDRVFLHCGMAFSGRLSRDGRDLLSPLFLARVYARRRAS